MEPVRAPWIRPGAVVHDPSISVDDLLADFAFALRHRGFRVAGFVQLNNHQTCGSDFSAGCAEQIDLLDLANGKIIALDREPSAANERALSLALASLRAAIRDNADLVIISRFAALENAAYRLMALVEDSIAQGMPVLTSIAGRCLQRWFEFAGSGGAMLAPDVDTLWQWWGAERLYGDLALGVAEVPVKRIVCGPRWLMVEGPQGAGLAHLPKSPAALLPELPRLQQMSLRELADLTSSWDGLEMALGIAAINAHYNRFDLDAAPGNGAQTFHGASGRVMVVGAFPGLAEILPQAQVIEAQPRPGELPTIAMDTVLPGCSTAVVSASSLINRTLPRILRLTQGARVALIGPTAPLTPRLHAYGIDVLGGLRVRDVDGLAEAVTAGVLPRDFCRFGDFVHLRASHPAVQPAVHPASQRGERRRLPAVTVRAAGVACASGGRYGREQAEHRGAFALGR